MYIEEFGWSVRPPRALRTARSPRARRGDTANIMNISESEGKSLLPKGDPLGKRSAPPAVSSGSSAAGPARHSAKSSSVLLFLLSLSLYIYIYV